MLTCKAFICPNDALHDFFFPLSSHSHNHIHSFVLTSLRRQSGAYLSNMDQADYTESYVHFWLSFYFFGDLITITSLATDMLASTSIIM